MRPSSGRLSGITIYNARPLCNTGHLSPLHPIAAAAAAAAAAAVGLSTDTGLYSL